MELSQCTIELQKYLYLKDKLIHNKLGTGSILVQFIECISFPTEQFPNNHFIQVSGLENGIGKNIKISIDLFFRTYNV
jgi:hypothetical protein